MPHKFCRSIDLRMHIAYAVNFSLMILMVFMAAMADRERFDGHI